MYKTSQSLAAALRVFVRRHNKFSATALRNYLVRDNRIITYSEFCQLFDTLGERSDCYSQISPRKYQFICKSDFFSDVYITLLVGFLKFEEETIPYNVYDTKSILKQLPDQFTVHDVVNITGGRINNVCRYITQNLLRRGIVVMVSPHRGPQAAVYRKTTAKPHVEPVEPVKPVIEEKKEVKPDRPLANVDLETLLNEISYRGIQWRLYGGPGKQPKV